MVEGIPAHVLKVNRIFHEAGFQIYLVGGCVRDLILGRPTSDWDFTTNATPEQILKLFPGGFYDNQFGTVGLPTEALENFGVPDSQEKSEVLEITTYRTEKEYKDRRHPAGVEWGKTVEEDLSRRDFTINAIALEVRTEDNRLHTHLIDPYYGQEDIRNKVLRAVGDPNLRFKEDALRLMRAIRLATQLGFTIDERTFQAIVQDARLLSEISKERIHDELLKILTSNYPYEGIMLLKNTGLLNYIIPELLEGIDVSQERPGRHHKTDVFTHNILSLKFTPASDPVVRLAALIHDIGKPKVAATDEHGYVIFHNHEIEGAKIAAEIADRLRFSRKDKQKIVTLVRWHMFTVDEHITDAAVRRFIRRVGVENVKDMMELRIGDRLGGGTQTAESWRLKLFKKRLEEQLAPEPFSIKNLVVDGNDVMKELDIKPGPIIGRILQKLFEEVDEDLEKNNRDYLLKRIKELQPELEKIKR